MNYTPVFSSNFIVVFNIISQFCYSVPLYLFSFTWCWSRNSNTLDFHMATYAKLTHWKTAWCWEGLGAGEGDDRGWDGWMASPTWWTWDWVNSGNWWWIGRPGVLRFMGSQRVGHDWRDWTELNCTPILTVSLPTILISELLHLGLLMLLNSMPISLLSPPPFTSL